MNRLFKLKTIVGTLVILISICSKAQRGFVWEESGSTTLQPYNISGMMYKYINGEIYLFKNHNYESEHYIKKWNGEHWIPLLTLDIGRYTPYKFDCQMMDAAMFQNDLFMAGRITSLNNAKGNYTILKRKKNCLGIVRFNGNVWDSLASYPQNPDSMIACTQMQIYKNSLYYIAQFRKVVSSTDAYNYYGLYKYSAAGTTSLITITKKKGDIFASLAVVNDKLLLGGQFDSIGNMAINSGLAVYDGFGITTFKKMPFTNVKKFTNRNDSEVVIFSNYGMLLWRRDTIIKRLDTSQNTMELTFYKNYIFRKNYIPQIAFLQYYDLDSSKWYNFDLPNKVGTGYSIWNALPADPDRAILVGQISSINSNGFFALELKPGSLLSGRIFIDRDSNCLYDSTEMVFKHTKVLFSKNNSQYFTSTDSTGKYEIGLSYGVHKVSLSLPGYSATSPCLKDSVNVTTKATINIDLPVKIDKRKNLSATITASRANIAVLGSTETYYLTCSNLSLNNDSLIVKLKYPAKLSLVSSDITPFSFSANELIYKFYNVQFGDLIKVTLKFKTDTAKAKLGDIFFLYSEILNSSGDYVIKNNYDTLKKTIVSSYDPNIKRCEPEGLVKSSPKKIQYTIYFQNTGNYKAYRVIVTDVLSDKLDLGSVRIISSSHPEILNYHSEDNKTLVFNFEGINLPDSGTNQEGSHGYVSFEVDVKETLAIDNSITNQAAIYFDYNNPIITNIASVKLIKDNSDVPTVLKSVIGSINAFPNPSNGLLTLQDVLSGFNSKTSIKVLNSMGQMMNVRMQGITSSEIKLDVSGLTNGFYTVLIDDNNAIKFIKE